MMVYLVRLRFSRSRVVHFWAPGGKPLCDDAQFIHGAQTRLALGRGAYEFYEPSRVARSSVLRMCKRCAGLANDMVSVIEEVENG